jgi:protein-arginine kinase activator protein McsA
MEDPSGKKKQPREAVAAESSAGTDDLKALTLDELTTLLNEVLEQEDYIRAIAIRDEINTRKRNRG